MDYASVTSGIEAATVAWESLGWRPVFFSEIEPFPCSVLAYHYPDIPNLGDMLKLRKNKTYNESTFNLLVGGTPCQDYSIAGKRAGLAGERGSLSLEFCRILEDKKPDWFLWENVPGALSSFSNAAESEDMEGAGPEDGRVITETSDFATILTAFRECGYSCAYRVLDAQFFGVPQRRRRIFVVGYLGDDWRPPAAVLFDGEGMSGYIKKGREAQEIVASLAKTGVGASGADDNQAQAGHIIACYGGNNSHSAINVATCRNARNNRLDFESDTFVLTQEPMLNNSNPKTGIIEISPIVNSSSLGTNMDLPVIFQPQASAYQSCNPSNISSTLDKSKIPDTLYSIMPMNSSKDFKARACDVSQPVMTRNGSLGNQGGDVILDELRVRRITPLEAERLQGFPDNYTLIPGSSDTTRYQAIGNSMAIPVMKWLGERIDFIDKLLKKSIAKWNQNEKEEQA